MCLDPWISSILCPSTPEVNAEVTGGEQERRFCWFQDGHLHICHQSFAWCDRTGARPIAVYELTAKRARESIKTSRVFCKTQQACSSNTTSIKHHAFNVPRRPIYSRLIQPSCQESKFRKSFPTRTPSQMYLEIATRCFNPGTAANHRILPRRSFALHITARR